MKRSEGFTLVELLVSFAVGAVVALAATSVMLLGLRFNAISTQAAQRQNTTRTLMAVLEGVIADGTMTRVENTLQSWKVYGEDDRVILSYSDEDDAIYSGTTKMLEGVIASHITQSGDLLTVSLETEDGSYSSSVYCRLYKEPTQVEPTPPEADSEVDTEDEVITQVQVNPTDFIRNLLSQYPSNGLPNIGVIRDDSGSATGKYYATWYAEKKGLNIQGWNSTTPWCACFVSWAMWKTDNSISNDRLFANVDEFMVSFGALTRTYQSGDVIFFSWNGDTNPEHVGVVLMTKGDYIYTIEGNSADMVALRMYEKNDPSIIGAGRIDWNPG